MAKYRKKETGKKNMILGVIFLVIVSYILVQSQPEVKVFPKQDAVCSVESCAFASRYSFSKGEAIPTICPKCGEKSFYSSRKCNACNKVTPLFPPKRDYTCTACEHREAVSLAPDEAPYPCPSCHKKTFMVSYQCDSCKHIFGHSESTPSTCPKCNSTASSPLTEELLSQCHFCQSTHLSGITPSVVQKFEMGFSLKPAEQKVYDQWKAAGGE